MPGDPRTFWTATASGGVWKSVNGGLAWKPAFDEQPVSSIGSIAVAPSDPNVVWVGSGEANIRGNVGEGNGIYRSTDAGKTWAHVWAAEGQIGTLAVHPRDPGVVSAAVLGSPFGPSEERGVYRTTDGGATWQRVLHVDRDTGASDVCLRGTPRSRRERMSCGVRSGASVRAASTVQRGETRNCPPILRSPAPRRAACVRCPEPGSRRPGSRPE